MRIVYKDAGGTFYYGNEYVDMVSAFYGTGSIHGHIELPAGIHKVGVEMRVSATNGATLYAVDMETTII
jgi:hypothetical protein